MACCVPRSGQNDFALSAGSLSSRFSLAYVSPEIHDDRTLCVVRRCPPGALLSTTVVFEQALERHMSYRDILVLRKEARGWCLEDMGDEPPENPPLDPELMSGIQESDPQARRLSWSVYIGTRCRVMEDSEPCSTPSTGGLLVHGMRTTTRCQRVFRRTRVIGRPLRMQGVLTCRIDTLFGSSRDGSTVTPATAPSCSSPTLCRASQSTTRERKPRRVYEAIHEEGACFCTLIDLGVLLTEAASGFLSCSPFRMRRFAVYFLRSLEHCTNNDPRDWLGLSSVHRTAARRALYQYEQLARYAARVQGLLLSAWEKSTCLREIMVETVIARQVEIRLFAKVDVFMSSEFVAGDGADKIFVFGNSVSPTLLFKGAGRILVKIDCPSLISVGMGEERLPSTPCISRTFSCCFHRHPPPPRVCGHMAKSVHDIEIHYVS